MKKMISSEESPKMLSFNARTNTLTSEKRSMQVNASMDKRKKSPFRDLSHQINQTEKTKIKSSKIGKTPISEHKGYVNYLKSPPTTLQK